MILGQDLLCLNMRITYGLMTKVTYLGHNIGEGCMMPLKAEVESLLKMPRPIDKKRLKSFFRCS